MPTWRRFCDENFSWSAQHDRVKNTRKRNAAALMPLAYAPTPALPLRDRARSGCSLAARRLQASALVASMRLGCRRAHSQHNRQTWSISRYSSKLPSKIVKLPGLSPCVETMTRTALSPEPSRFPTDSKTPRHHDITTSKDSHSVAHT